MTNAYGNHSQDPKTGAVASGDADHQREDQPLKELNEDPDDKENGTAKDGERRNGQGDHEGSPQDPAEFDPVNPAVQGDKK